MARKTAEYKSQAKTVAIRITSRASVPVTTKSGTSFYTVEYCEERSIPDTADVSKERALLWDVCNNECDKQIEDILKVYNK